MLSSAAGICSGDIARRNLSTWSAFTSWRRATIETDEPGQRLGDNPTLQCVRPLPTPANLAAPLSVH